MTTYLFRYLKLASKKYYEGNPIISDEQFDSLAESIGYSDVGAKEEVKTVPHYRQMYSLQKYYNGEGTRPLQEYSKPKVATPKLDGAAISILYYKGELIQVATRGDGVEGQDITDKFIQSNIIPTSIEDDSEYIQVIGEVVAPSSIKNARNYASGALNLKDQKEFLNRELYFVAYGVYPHYTSIYSTDMNRLESMGFKTVMQEDFCSQFPHDGIVVRINSYEDFNNLGYTSSHPRGAFAIKERKQGVATTLIGVEWQTGKSGRVTPVALLDPVDIDGAMVTRATLNNVGFIKALDLSIGDRVLVVRSGEIIPTILGKESSVEE